MNDPSALQGAVAQYKDNQVLAQELFEESEKRLKDHVLAKGMPNAKLAEELMSDRWPLYAILDSSNQSILHFQPLWKGSKDEYKAAMKANTDAGGKDGDVIPFTFKIHRSIHHHLVAKANLVCGVPGKQSESQAKNHTLRTLTMQ